MIGPVSTTGRAMMSSLQQQMAKGMPPDQAIAYVKSMAQDGVAPLVDLYAMMKQFQRLKEQQVKPPQTPPTVRDQINALAQHPQGLAGLAGPQGAPQGMPQQMQGQPPMEQGLGGMDAGSMENPSFAGGGIVAFADGGDTSDYEGVYGRLKGSKQILGGLLGSGISAENLGMLRNPEQFSTEEVARLFAIALSKGDIETATPLRYVLKNRGLDDSTLLDIERKTRSGREAVESVTSAEQKLNMLRTGQPEVAPTQVAVPPPPKEEKTPARVIKKPAAAAAAAPKEMTLEDRISEAQSPLIARGILTKEGKSKATDDYRKVLEGEQERMDKYFGRQKSYSLAEAGFKMAQAASRPGATFLGALSEGGISHAQAMQGMNKEIELNRRQMQQQKYLLDKADEADARGDVDRAQALRSKYEDQMIDLQKHRERLGVDLMQIRATAENTAEAREMRKEIFGQSSRNQVIERMTELRQNDPEYRIIQSKIAKADEDELPDLQAKLKAVNDRLYREATGADLPGMRPEDVSQASDALKNIPSDKLAETLRALGYTVGSPTR